MRQFICVIFKLNSRFYDSQFNYFLFLFYLDRKREKDYYKRWWLLSLANRLMQRCKRLASADLESTRIKAPVADLLTITTNQLANVNKCLKTRKIKILRSSSRWRQLIIKEPVLTSLKWGNFYSVGWASNKLSWPNPQIPWLRRTKDFHENLFLALSKNGSAVVR